MVVRPSETIMDFFDSDEFTNHVLELLKEWNTPGVAVAIVQDEAVASRGYGQARLEPSKPMTPDTLLDIASSSKSLTAAATALLLDDHAWKWETPMSKLLPEDFVMSRKEYTEGVTVEDVLSHRTGLPG